MNKKANMNGMLLVSLFLFLIVIVGFFIIIGSAITNYVMDVVTPELSGLGMVGVANVSEAMDYTIVPLNNFVQNFTWIAGVLYLFGIVGVFALAFMFKNTGEKWLIGLYLGFVLILVISCIFISNIYENFYDDNDDLGTRLKEHTLLSYMLLYSPAIMGIIAFITGIILFGGTTEEYY